VNSRENNLPYPDRFKQTVHGFANFTPTITFHHSILERWILKDVHGLCDDLPKLGVYVRQCFDTQTSNDQFFVSNNYGDVFRFSLNPSQFVSGTQYYSMSVWDATGGTSIGRIALLGNKVSDQKMYRQLVRKMDRFTEGFVCCSDCDKEMLYLEAINRRFYSGIYCAYCWERTWREKEAREKYD
jgi:hypothetical protein